MFFEDMIASLDMAWGSFVAGFDQFFIHFFTTAVMLAIGMVIYTQITPHAELRLARQGNAAAGLSLGSALLGLSIPLAVCMATSINWADIVVWGAVTILLQLFTFRIAHLVLRNLPKRIEAGEVSAAAYLASVQLSMSAIVAAAVSGAPLARYSV